VAPTQTPLGELTALPHTPYSWIKGPTYKGRGEEGQEGEGEDKSQPSRPPNLYFWIRPWECSVNTVKIKIHVN